MIQRRALSSTAPEHVPAEGWFAVHHSNTRVLSPERRYQLVWQGTLNAVHSLAHVNRQIVMQLDVRGRDIATIPSPFREADAASFELGENLSSLGRKSFERPDAHIRHQWPPDWLPPKSGHLVIMQPWEFGAIPASWIQPLTTQVDEIWVPSNFVRDSFLSGGVPKDRIFVIPLGVATDWLAADPSPFRLRTKKRSSSCSWEGRWNAKASTSSLKLTARSSQVPTMFAWSLRTSESEAFYRNQTAEHRIAAFRAYKGAPEIEYLRDSLSESEMAGLYSACGLFVHPFRGEGFGLPIVEAMGADSQSLQRDLAQPSTTARQTRHFFCRATSRFRT